MRNSNPPNKKEKITKFGFVLVISDIKAKEKPKINNKIPNLIPLFINN
jgi:hypothetical protein